MIFRKILGKIMIEMGFVTKQELEEALQRQGKILEEKILPERISRDRLLSEARLAADRVPLLGETLIGLGLITKEQLSAALNEQGKTLDAYKSLKRENLATAIEIGAILNSTLGLAEVLANIMSQACRVTNSVASTLMLLDEETGELVFSVPTGPKADKLTDIRIPPGKGIAGWVVEHKEPLLIPDAGEDERFYQEIDKISGLETKSILCVPLKAKNKLIGVLEVINKADGTPFTGEDELLLNIFAYQAALAIENARVYRELHDSEERYRYLFNNAADLIAVVDMEGNFLDLNRKFDEESGFSREEMIGKNVFTCGILTESSSARAAQYLEDLLAGREGSILEIDGVRKDGGVVPYELKAVPIERDGKIEAIQAILRNLSERRQAEEALSDSEKTIKSIFQAAPIGIGTVVDRVIMEANDRFFEMLGYSRGELLNKSSTIVYPTDEEYEYVEKEKYAQIQEFGIGTVETNWQRKDGKVIDVLLNSAPIDPTDQSKGLTFTALDITERKHLETQLRQAQKMEAIGTLAGGIAHEFNNILGIILGNAELAIDDVPEWNPAKESLKEIRSASLRAKDVVRQILSFARRTTPMMKPINISSIIKGEFKLLRASIPTTIEMKMNLEGDTDIISGDPTQINQVLINLCTNAADAMSEAGGVLKISLENVMLDATDEALDPDLSPGKYVKLTVSDTGHGIAVGDLNRIFDPYYSTKDVGKGTGMGLSVVHGIIKGHGGSIKVQSEPGVRTTFEIFLPAIQKEAAPEIGIVADLPTGTERILFVDDEASLVSLNHQRLERLGYEVKSTQDPLEAMKLFRSDPDLFDLVITDMTMPRMTGDELAQEILKVRPNLPVILCTGYSEKISESSAKEIGIRKYIEKPVDIQKLAITVREVLDGK